MNDSDVPVKNLSALKMALNRLVNAGKIVRLSNTIQLGTIIERKPEKRGEYKIRFIRQKNTITKDNIYYKGRIAEVMISGIKGVCGKGGLLDCMLPLI